MNKTISVLCMLAVCVIHGTLDAAIIQYSDRATFEAAAGAVTTEDFEAFAPGTDVFEGISFDFGEFSAFNGVNSFDGGDIRTGGGSFTVNGSTEIVGATFIGGAELELTFDSPITAIGFDAGQLSDQRNNDLIFNNTAGDVVAIFDPVDQVRFWGFISDTPFTTFNIRLTGFQAGGGSGDGFFIDDVTYAASDPVPEPGSLAIWSLLGVGAAAYGWRKKRGKTKTA